MPKPKPKPFTGDWPLAKLPGLNAKDLLKLQQSGISTTSQLLEQTNTPDKQQALANQLQITLKYINKWVVLAKLAQIPSVGYIYCGLILHAGVNSIEHLASIPINQLHRQIMRLQVTTMQRRDLCPSVELVQTWIQQAQAHLRHQQN